MNSSSMELMRDHPELVRMVLTYLFGFFLIGFFGWWRVFQRLREGTLRQVESTFFALPFAIGLGFFLILLGVLFLVRGYTAMVVTVIGYFYLMNQAGWGVAKVLGVDRYSSIKIACAALGITAIVFAPAYFFSWVNSILCFVFHIESGAQPLIEEFLKMTDLRSILSFIGLAVVVAPLTEEILFRGLLYPVLRDQLGVKWGAIISAALFGAIHLHFPTFLPLTLLGLILALSYEFSGSLLLSMMIHGTFNLFTILNLLLLKPYLFGRNIDLFP